MPHSKPLKTTLLFGTLVLTLPGKEKILDILPHRGQVLETVKRKSKYVSKPLEIYTGQAFNDMTKRIQGE